jgi:hypothetical protein
MEMKTGLGFALKLARIRIRTVVSGSATNEELKNCAGIFNQSMGARNRVGIGLSHRLARPHSLAELVPWNRFLGSVKV